MRTLLKRISAIALALPLLFLSFELCVRYPCNHGGGAGIYVLLGLFALAVSALYMLLAKRLFVFHLAMFSLLAILIFICNWFNIYLSYEEWIERGMPEWGSRWDGSHVEKWHRPIWDQKGESRQRPDPEQKMTLKNAEVLNECP